MSFSRIAAAKCREIASREIGAWCFTATSVWSSWPAGGTRAARSWRRRPIKPECELLLGMIQALYDVETRAAGADLAGSPGVAVARVDDHLWTPSGSGWTARRWARCCRRATSPRRCGICATIGPALNVYVGDGRIPIDNNSVERLMKQVAMGRKAWLFVCSVAGGEQSAKMMTLVSSAAA